MLILILLLVVGAVAFAAYTFMGGAQDSARQRLKRYTQEAPKAEPGVIPLADAKPKGNVFENVDKAIEKQDFFTRIQHELNKADVKLKVSEYLSIRFVCATLFALILFLKFGLLGAGGGGFLGWIIPRIQVGRLQKKRQHAFQDQIGDTLTSISGALKSGNSFLQALEFVAREARPPMSIEVGRILRETALGMQVDESLQSLCKRMESDDFELVVTSVLIQRQTGGNLAEVLDSIAFTIRERIKLKRQVMALTAMGRLSGMVVSVLPIGLMVVLYFLNKEFMMPLFTTLYGKIMLGIGGFNMTTGVLIIRKVITIDV